MVLLSSSCWSLPPSPVLPSLSSWMEAPTLYFSNASRRPSIVAMTTFPSAQVIQARISAAASTGRLDLSNCGLEEVPPQVFALKDLEELSLAWNNISHFPDGIENLKNLRHLGLSGNWLVGLPSNTGKLVQLESLWVQGNLLEHLPIEIGTLKNLSILNLTGNMLEDIPESVGSLFNLKLLSLSGNQLKNLPSGLGNMAALKILNVNGNRLQSLPMSLEGLSSLKKLSLQGNRLKYLPTNLPGNALEELTVADNELLELPDSIEDAKCLETLSLYGNRLVRLPESICRLNQLRSLWLEGNPLDALSESLLSAPNLKALGVDSKLALPTRSQGEPYKSLRVCKLAGTGLATSLGGYFKLQQFLEEPAKVVVVAFGSAPGVPNWGGLLSRLKAAMLTDDKAPAFDVLYVVDARRSWYTETKSGEEWHLGSSALGGGPGCVSSEGSELNECASVGAYYHQELSEALEGYKRVVMIGDSMGASAGLLFSPLATSVIAFCPQVDMVESAIRPGRGRSWLDTYKQELLHAVMASSAHITVHCGNWEHDIHQAKLLPKKVHLVVHNSDSHRLAKELDLQGTLLNIIRKTVDDEIASARSLHLLEHAFKSS